MRCQYLDLADFLLVAERVLGTPTEVLVRTARLPLAESALNAPAAGFGGEEFADLSHWIETSGAGSFSARPPHRCAR